nr:MAG TPA: hypothetical protein [Caudoviricetes sp.]
MSTVASYAIRSHARRASGNLLKILFIQQNAIEVNYILITIQINY